MMESGSGIVNGVKVVSSIVLSKDKDKDCLFLAENGFPLLLPSILLDSF